MINDVYIKYLLIENKQSTIWEVQERQRPQEGESICWEFHCEAGEPTAHIEPKSKKNILDKNLRILKVKYSRERRLSEPINLSYIIYLRCSIAGVNVRIASLIVWCLKGSLLIVSDHVAKGKQTSSIFKVPSDGLLCSFIESTTNRHMPAIKNTKNLKQWDIWSRLVVKFEWRVRNLGDLKKVSILMFTTVFVLFE